MYEEMACRAGATIGKLGGPCRDRSAQAGRGWWAGLGILFGPERSTSHITTSVSVFTFERREELENAILSFMYILCIADQTHKMDQPLSKPPPLPSFRPCLKDKRLLILISINILNI